MGFNFDVGRSGAQASIWRQTPLFHVTILATLCIKGLSSVDTCCEPTQFAAAATNHAGLSSDEMRSDEIIEIR